MVIVTSAGSSSTHARTLRTRHRSLLSTHPLHALDEDADRQPTPTAITVAARVAIPCDSSGIAHVRKPRRFACRRSDACSGRSGVGLQPVQLALVREGPD